LDTLSILRVPLDALHLDPANARQHGERNLEAIRASLASFGQVEPLVVHKPTQRVIGGNGRLAAMRALGWTHADPVELDVTTTSPVRTQMLGLHRNLDTMPPSTGQPVALPFPRFPKSLQEIATMLALRSTTTAFLLSLMFLLGLAAFSPTARAQDVDPRDEFFFTAGQVTGVITEVHYDGGQVSSFVVKDANNQTMTIKVKPPEQAITTAVVAAASAGRKVTVEYHTTGNPPELVYDGMTVYY